MICVFLICLKYQKIIDNYSHHQPFSQKLSHSKFEFWCDLGIFFKIQGDDCHFLGYLSDVVNNKGGADFVYEVSYFIHFVKLKNNKKWGFCIANQVAYLYE